MAFNLLQGIQNNGDHDQQGSTTKEHSKVTVDANSSCKSRQNRNNSQKYCTRQSNAGSNGIDIISSWLSWFYRRNESVVALEVFRIVLRVDDQSGIHIGEYNDQQEVDQVVRHTSKVVQSSQNTGSCSTTRCTELSCRSRQKHQSLCKDDRHYTGSIELKWDIILLRAHAYTVVSAYCFFSHLNGYSPHRLNNHDR